MERRYGVLLSPAAWEQPQLGKLLAEFSDEAPNGRCVYCDQIDDSIIPGFVTLVFDNVAAAEDVPEEPLEIMLPSHLIMCVVHGMTDTKIGF